MIFESLYISSFGKLSDQKFNFSEGVNIVEGANESGKSTICGFIRFMFYGLPAKPDEKIRPISWRDSRAAGSLTFSEDGKRYRIEREVVCVTSSDGKPSYREKCAVYDADTNLVCFKGQSPGEVFFGVSGSVFDSTVYIRQTENTRVGGHELGEEAENILFSANESINTKKAIAKLDSARVFLLHKNRRGGKIAELESARDETAEKLETAMKASGDIIYLEGTRRQLSEKKEEAEHRLEAVKAELEKYERYTMKKAYLRRKAEKARLVETEETIAAKKSPPEHGGRDISSDGYIASLEKMQGSLELAASRYADAEAALSDATQKITDMSEKLAIFERFGAKGGKTREELISKTRSMRRARSASVKLFTGAFILAALFAVLCTVLFFGVPDMPAVLKYITAALIPVFAVIGIVFLVRSASLKTDIRTICAKFGCADYDEFEELVRAASEDEAYMVFITGARDEANDKFNAASAKLEQISAEILEVLGKDGFEISGNTATSLSEAIASCRSIRTELAGLESAYEEQKSRIAEIEESLAAYPKEYLKSACLDEYDEEEMESFNLTAKRRDSEFLSAAIASQTDKLHQIDVELSALTATAIRPTELAEQKAALDEEIRELTAKWDAYMLAIESLEKASGKLREGISPKIAKSAAKLMGALTDGKYSEIGVDMDFGLSFSDGALMRDAAYLSAGTGDVAYICLRIALIELLYKKAVPPFLFDESFVRMDDARLSKMLSLIYKYSQRSYQSILFTCHEREKTIMETVGSCNILSI